MCNLLPPPRLASAAVVFFGHYGDVSHFAAEQGTYRQSLYREAHTVARDLDPSVHQQQISHFHQCLADLQAQIDELQRQLSCSVIVDRDKQAEFAATAQAQGVSLSAARILLAVLLRTATPSIAKLGRLSRAAGRQASALLAVLDEYSGSRARQIAADEIFTGHKPILMTLEQDSMCWMGGRLAESRDGVTWAEELRRLPAAEQVTSDGALGICNGLDQVNQERQRTGLSAIAGQRDHFHVLKRARRALRQTRHRAERALRAAERVQHDNDKVRRHCARRSSMQGRLLNQLWDKAGLAFDEWSAAEKAFARLRSGLRLFTPDGELNTRTRVEQEVGLALAGQTGADWSRTRCATRAVARAYCVR